jgi:hypothetical protein
MNRDIFQLDGIETQYSIIPLFHYSNCLRGELSSDFHHDLPINGVGYRVLVSYIFALLRVFPSNFGAM